MKTKSEINKLKSLLDNSFKDLSFFEEEHKYYLKNKQLSTSVSGVIKNFYKPFNVKEGAKKVSDQYLGILSKEEITEQWSFLNKMSTNEGTKVHVFGEFYPFDKTLKPRNKQEEACKLWWDSMPSYYKPLKMEQRMYHYNYLFGGTADITLYNEKTGNIVLADYKTNKNLFNNFAGKKMLKEWGFLLDQSFSHYIIQLNIYKILLEQIDGIKVENLMLVHLQRNGKPKMYKIDIYKEITLESLKNIYEK